jgi:hypothetical protein
MIPSQNEVYIDAPQSNAGPIGYVEAAFPPSKMIAV